jgi:hypothetical protein
MRPSLFVPLSRVIPRNDLLTSIAGLGVVAVA